MRDRYTTRGRERDKLWQRLRVVVLISKERQGFREGLALHRTQRKPQRSIPPGLPS